MNYFTSDSYEKELDERYMKYIKIKQEELDNNYNNKYTAYAYIFRPERVFCVEEDGTVYLGSVAPENIAPKELVTGGKKYVLDRGFEKKVMEFIQRYKKYKVMFSPDGTYGPTCCYCSSVGEVPAKLESYNGIVLTIENDDKYDICIG